GPVPGVRLVPGSVHAGWCGFGLLDVPLAVRRSAGRARVGRHERPPRPAAAAVGQRWGAGRGAPNGRVVTGLRRFVKGASPANTPTADTPTADTPTADTPPAGTPTAGTPPASPSPTAAPANSAIPATNTLPANGAVPTNAAAAVEKCEMCGAALAPTPGHIVDIEHRSPMCACRPCFLLFTHGNTAGGRYRAVPQRYLHDPDSPLTRAEWERLGIPVGSAFFLRAEATGLA